MESAAVTGGYFMRLTEDQYAAMLKRNTAPGMPAAPKKSKFKSIRCRSHDGFNFASRLERDYYEQLCLRRQAGDVLWFLWQVPFWLEGGVKYVADFLVVSADKIEIIDTTGVATQVKINKLKQVKARYGIDVQLVRSA